MVAGGSQTQWGTTNANCIGVTSLRHQWPQIPAPSQCYQACPTPLSNSLRPPQWHLLWQVTREKNFRIHYLPSYAPEYNPEEYLNRNIKAAAAEQALPASQQAAVLQTTATLQRHRDDRESVRRLFKNEKVRYAAE